MQTKLGQKFTGTTSNRDAALKMFATTAVNKATGSNYSYQDKNLVVRTGNSDEIVNGKRRKKTGSILNLGSGVASGSINKKNAYGIGV
jgi:hypothetical protein